MSARYDGTILDHLEKHMLFLSTASLFCFSLSLSHDHGFHLSQQLGMSPHDYEGLLVAQSNYLGPDSKMSDMMHLALIVIIV
jgi:hypothetical protein